MYAQYLAARGTVGDADRDFAVESSGPPQCRVHQFRHVGGADDHHLAAIHQTIHQRQELCHHPLFHIADDLGALGCQRVEFV